MNPMNHFFRSASRMSSSGVCRHTHLVMLPDPKHRRQCRHCGRTLTAETPDIGCCPHCLVRDGVRRSDFRETNVIDVSFARYRCEDCGTMIHSE